MLKRISLLAVAGLVVWLLVMVSPKMLSAAGPPFTCRLPGYSSPGVEPANDDSDQTR